MSKKNEQHVPIINAKKLSEQQIDTFMKGNLSAFYATVAEVFGFEKKEENRYDCTKITVSSSIIKKWEDQFIQKYGREHVRELYIHLAKVGPKTDCALKQDEVNIQEGFVLNFENEKD